MPEKLSKSGKPLGPIGTKVLFENEHVRVWSVELPGKGHQPLHEHEHPYLIVPVSEGKALMRWEDGREREITDVLGNVVYREASGGPHELFNLEDTKFHSILVELKGGGRLAEQSRHAAQPTTGPFFFAPIAIRNWPAYVRTVLRQVEPNSSCHRAAACIVRMPCRPTTPETE